MNELDRSRDLNRCIENIPVIDCVGLMIMLTGEVHTMGMYTSSIGNNLWWMACYKITKGGIVPLLRGMCQQE